MTIAKNPLRSKHITPIPKRRTGRCERIPGLQGWIKNETKGEVTEQIRSALKLAATKLQLKFRQNLSNQDIFSDYHARELIE